MRYSGRAVVINPRIPDERRPLLATRDVVIAQTIQRTLREQRLVFPSSCEPGREMAAKEEVSDIPWETEGLAVEMAFTYYEGVLTGRSPGEATQHARLHLNLRESHPHDVTWASFVL